MNEEYSKKQTKKLLKQLDDEFKKHSYEKVCSSCGEKHIVVTKDNIFGRPPKRIREGPVVSDRIGKNGKRSIGKRTITILII